MPEWEDSPAACSPFGTFVQTLHCRLNCLLFKFLGSCYITVKPTKMYMLIAQCSLNSLVQCERLTNLNISHMASVHLPVIVPGSTPLRASVQMAT